MPAMLETRPTIPKGRSNTVNTPIFRPPNAGPAPGDACGNTLRPSSRDWKQTIAYLENMKRTAATPKQREAGALKILATISNLKTGQQRTITSTSGRAQSDLDPGQRESGARLAGSTKRTAKRTDKEMPTKHSRNEGSAAA